MPNLACIASVVFGQKCYAIPAFSILNSGFWVKIRPPRFLEQSALDIGACRLFSSTFFLVNQEILDKFDYTIFGVELCLSPYSLTNLVKYPQTFFKKIAHSSLIPIVLVAQVKRYTVHFSASLIIMRCYRYILFYIISRCSVIQIQSLFYLVSLRMYTITIRYSCLYSRSNRRRLLHYEYSYWELSSHITVSQPLNI